MADVFRAHDTPCVGRTSNPLLDSLREETITLLKKLDKLLVRWDKRKDKLKIDPDDFDSYSQIYDCRVELLRVVSKHKRRLKKTCEK